MKNIFLSIVIICALAIAGIGGTLATLTDTEESFDSKIEVGSLDLKVNDNDDVGVWWGNGVGSVIQQTCLLPGTPMQTLVKVENEGCLDGYLYLVFKDLDCYNTETHGGAWYEDPNVRKPAKLKPEPELVAEYGGWLAQKNIRGIGRLGDNCCMSSHTFVWAGFDKHSPFLDDVVIGDLNKIVQYVGVLPHCGGNHFINFLFDVPQIPESDYGRTYFNDFSPFDHWPTNALMADGISFDVLFILVDHQLSAEEIRAIQADL